MRRAALYSLVPPLCALVTALAGCPGSIDEEMFRASREGGTPRDTGAAGACPPTVTDVQRDLIMARCATAGCHTTMDRLGGLDLESPGLGARLIDVRASSMGACSGRTLVTISGATVDGVFFGKLGDTATCGTRMPPGGSRLTAQEIECLKEYMRTLASTPSDGGSAMDAAAPRDSGTMDARSGG